MNFNEGTVQKKYFPYEKNQIMLQISGRSCKRCGSMLSIINIPMLEKKNSTNAVESLCNSCGSVNDTYAEVDFEIPYEWRFTKTVMAPKAPKHSLLYIDETLGMSSLDSEIIEDLMTNKRNTCYAKPGGATYYRIGIYSKLKYFVKYRKYYFRGNPDDCYTRVYCNGLGDPTEEVKYLLQDRFISGQIEVVYFLPPTHEAFLNAGLMDDFKRELF